jgi:hypothetical protein
MREKNVAKLCSLINVASFCELSRLLFQADFEDLLFRNLLFRRKFPHVLSNFDELRLPAKLPLRVTLNVIYPTAPAWRRVHGHAHQAFV